MAGRRRAVIAGSLGTIIEWYDFSLYVFLAPIYARVFFPNAEGLEGVTATLALFAVSYLARPVGAVVFGHFGDRVGRRSALLVSASIMSVALLLNGLLPSEGSIGVAAPILLFVLRLAMAFAVGGEYSGILVYLLESAGPRRRGLIASLAPATSGLGTLLAVGFTAVVTAALTPDQVDSWGWRIPVELGAVLAAAILLLRTTMSETPAFRSMREAGRVSETPVRDALTRARPAVLVAFGLSAVGSISYYLGVTYVPTFLDSVASADSGDALLWSTVATAVLLAVTPLVGLAADAAGRRRTLGVTAAWLIAGSIPLFALLSNASAVAALAGAIGLAIGAGAWSAAAASTIPEQFATPDRFSGLAIGYNLATAVFGGLSPLLATLLVRWTDWDLAPGLMLALVALAAVPMLLGLSETSRLPLRGTD